MTDTAFAPPAATDVAWPVVPRRLPLTEDAVREIVALDDPSLRNLWITQSYGDLARRLLATTTVDQTWCTFAIWTSSSAGRSIRCDEPSKRVDELLRGADGDVDAIVATANTHTATLQRLGLVRALERCHVERMVERALGQVSASIANGNTMVFGELAPIFVRFVERLERAGAPAPDRVEGMLDAAGVPVQADAPLVRLAFEQYALAAGSHDPAQRAQHVLAANIAAVIHEQQRLQPFIAAALDAAVIDVGDDLCGTVHGKLLDAVNRRLADDVRAHVAPHVERLWHHVATQLMMTLSVPGETFLLGHDVPALPGTPLFPPALLDVDLPELDRLLDGWDHATGSGHGSGAGGWADLHQRVGYFITLLRSRQQHLPLTVPPFTPAQLSSMMGGEVPPSL